VTILGSDDNVYCKRENRPTKVAGLSGTIRPSVPQTPSPLFLHQPWKILVPRPFCPTPRIDTLQRTNDSSDMKVSASPRSLSKSERNASGVTSADQASRLVRERQDYHTGRESCPSGKMARGICKKCGKEIGTFMRPLGWKCPKCGFVYCGPCSPKIGMFVKTPACPDCGVVMRQ
jgi:predicted RNA-binding Zn-ribbon protein involved in translation (DUF1610 family)